MGYRAVVTLEGIEGGWPWRTTLQACQKRVTGSETATCGSAFSKIRPVKAWTPGSDESSGEGPARRTQPSRMAQPSRYNRIRRGPSSSWSDLAILISSSPPADRLIDRRSPESSAPPEHLRPDHRRSDANAARYSSRRGRPTSHSSHVAGRSLACSPQRGRASTSDFALMAGAPADGCMPPRFTRPCVSKSA